MSSQVASTAASQSSDGDSGLSALLDQELQSDPSDASPVHTSVVPDDNDKYGTGQPEA